MFASLVAWTAPSLALAGELAWKGTALLLLACACDWLCRRAAASARHFLWSLTLVALLALPALGWLLPPVALPVQVPSFIAQQPPREDSAIIAVAAPWETAKHQALSQAPRKAEEGLLAQSADPVKLVPAPSAPATRAGITPALFSAWSSWLVGTWLAGVCLAWLWLATGWLSLAWLRRRTETIASGPVFDMGQSLANELGVRRPILLLHTLKATVPMTWGLLRPAILLPAAAASWSPARLRMVLLHELAHVRRWDCLMLLVAHLARGLYWFNPLVWLAVRRLRTEQENACDDFVLAHGADAPDYAELLLAVTVGFRSDFLSSSVSLCVAKASRIRQRLTILLDPARDRRRLSWLRVVGAAALAGLLVISLAAVGLVPAAAQEKPPAEQKKEEGKAPDSGQRLLDVKKKLLELYAVPLDEKKLAEDALKGLLQGLKDPYTDLIPATEMKTLKDQMAGSMTGIGAQLKDEGGRLTVVTPLEGSPALKAGLRPGDVIETIDGATTRGLSLSDAIKRILGKQGTTVKLKVQRADGALEELTIIRGLIRVGSVHGFNRTAEGQWNHWLDPERKIAYLQVLQFSAETAKEVKSALEPLEKTGLKGLILDLRFCPGGLLDQAVATCSLLLDKGTIVTIKGAQKEVKTYAAEGKAILKDVPLIVLINEQTASAAEIMAGALRDNERAVLVGSRTFGKGSVQMLLKLNDESVLKFTTAFHYLPSGRNIQKKPGSTIWGVDPTDGYYVPLTSTQNEKLQGLSRQRAVIGMSKEEQPKAPARLTPQVLERDFADPQMAAALRTMVSKLTGGEFIKTGKALAQLQDDVGRLEELTQRRKTLQSSLEQLDREIADLQKRKK